MDEFEPFIGKKLIKILMFDMYPDAKIIYREYIQNACDAINDAVKRGVLNQNKDGHISVNIDSSERTIRISDNGIGIPFDDAIPVLLNIADSQKDGISAAGQFGIGRLVGAGYCKRLSFKTSFKGENKGIEIIFDVVKAKEIIVDKDDHSSASQVIDSITTKSVFIEDVDSHYFTATLYDVRPEYPELLNEDTIVSYLKEVAPIDYGMPFKNNLVHKSICGEYSENHSDIAHYKISINEELDIRKRYGLKIEGIDDEIHCLQYFKIKDEDYGLLAWGWYAVTAFSKAIPRGDENRGIRLRKHNIQIGDSHLLNQYFSEPRGNNYFYGEIHAVHKELIPDSSRSGLAPTPEAIRFQEHLRLFFDSLVKLYHLANDYKNAVKEVVSITSKVDESADSPEANAKYELAQKKLENVERGKNAQSEVAKTVMEIIKQTSNTLALEKSEHKTIPTPKSPEKEAPYSLDKLKGKYHEDEILLISRIFTILTDNCPVKDKKLIEELKKKIVKDLAKK